MATVDVNGLNTRVEFAFCRYCMLL